MPQDLNNKMSEQPRHKLEKTDFRFIEGFLDYTDRNECCYLKPLPKGAPSQVTFVYLSLKI